MPYDVFLSYHSPHVNEVAAIAKRLQQNGIRYFFDKEHLEPGDVWLDVLQEHLTTVSVAVIFLCDDGPGPWQTEEYRELLERAVKDGCRVIPYVLGATRQDPPLLPFIRRFQRIDGRQMEPDPTGILIEAIKKALNGAAPRDKWALRRLSLRDEALRQLAHGHSILIVGPKLFGKSKFLRDVVNQVPHYTNKPWLVHYLNLYHLDLSRDYSGILHQLASWIVQSARPEDSVAWLSSHAKDRSAALSNGQFVSLLTALWSEERRPILLVLDEADDLLSGPMDKDFAALLRMLAGLTIRPFKPLKLQLAVAATRIAGKDIGSPLNNAILIYMGEWREEQLRTLSRDTGPLLPADIAELQEEFGGHPAILSTVLNALERQRSTEPQATIGQVLRSPEVRRLCDAHISEVGRLIERYIKRHGQQHEAKRRRGLEAGLQQLANGVENIDDKDLFIELDDLGLVIERNGKYCLRGRLYRQLLPKPRKPRK